MERVEAPREATRSLEEAELMRMRRSSFDITCWRGEQQQLPVDPVFVHMRKAQLAALGKLTWKP